VTRRLHEIQIAEGEIVEVVQRDDRGVFLRVELRRYRNEDGTPLEALCRLVVDYHGAAHGNWHVPDVGLDVLCFFPGGGHHGLPGGDLDEGYVLGFLSSMQEPPVVTGVNGALSATRRIYKGKVGVAHDVHRQGDVDAKVDGAETTENVGAVSRVFRAAAEWLGDALLRIQAATDLLLHGGSKVDITSDTLIRLTAPEIQLVGNTTIESRDFMDHTHGGVEPGGGSTSGVN
jgi:hypothetical protein